MNTKLLGMAALGLALAGCGDVYYARRPYRERVVVVERPGPVVVAQPAPVYVEEGAVVNGVVIVEPAVVPEYVFIGGGWYYWHPGCRCWVHAVRPRGWQPAVSVRVYRSWNEHPMYHHH